MRVFATFATLILLAGTAHAGVFGGFVKRDQRYVKGKSLCSPIPVGLETAAPTCTAAGPQELAAISADKPAPISGANPVFRATFAGTKLTVTPSVGSPFVWSSVDPIVGVGSLYIDVMSRYLAVEFQTRMGGRVVEDVVVFVLPQSKDIAAAQAAAAVDNTPKRTKEVAAAIAKGHKQLKRKRWKAAEKAFRKALAEADDPEARYGVAVALARRKKLQDALVELEAIAKSPWKNASMWRVIARHNKAFRKLVADKRFRLAVGIDAKPGEARTAYERAVAVTNRWEQPEVKCDRPQINLDLRRRPQTFKLTIKTTCGGYTDRTKLSGSWNTSRLDRVELTFPNPGGKAEKMPCVFTAAKDGTGEDVLTCGKGTDMEMTLRTVRR